MIEDLCYTLQNLLERYKGDSIKIIKSSMRGRTSIDRILREALKIKKYQEWCNICGVDYRELLGFI